MKILQVAMFLTPRRGGTSTFPYILSQELIKRGHAVTILTTDFELDDDYVRKIRSKGVEVVSFHCVANIGLYLVSPSMKPWLKKNIGEYDVIHLHGLRSYQNELATKFARKTGRPVVLQAHGSVRPLYEKRLLKKLYDMTRGGKILKSSTRLVAVTNTELNDYERAGAERKSIEIVPVGIQAPEGEERPERGEFRRSHGIGYDEKVVLYAGRIHGTKGLDLLIRAYAGVADRIPKSRLLLVGQDDGYRDYLERLAKSLNIRVPENLMFLGFVKEREKLAALIDADVFVTPRFYGFPATFLESLMCGTPIVTTDDGDSVDWIDGRAGYVVSYDEKMMRDAIIRILENEQLRNELGQRGRDIAIENHNWHSVAERFEEIYGQCIKQHA